MTLMSFKLADLVNIALEEKSYFKDKAWCEKNKANMLVEHDQEKWTKDFFKGYQNLKTQEKKNFYGSQSPSYSENLQPIVEFFKTL